MLKMLQHSVSSTSIITAFFVFDMAYKPFKGVVQV